MPGDDADASATLRKKTSVSSVSSGNKQTSQEVLTLITLPQVITIRHYQIGPLGLVTDRVSHLDALTWPWRFQHQKIVA